MGVLAASRNPALIVVGTANPMSMLQFQRGGKRGWLEAVDLPDQLRGVFNFANVRLTEVVLSLREYFTCCRNSATNWNFESPKRQKRFKSR